MRRLWHLPWLLCTLVLSFLCIRLWNPFFGMGTESFHVMMLSALAISHILAAVVGWFLMKRTLRRVVWVVSLAFIPAILFSLQQAYDAVHLRYNAVYDRFRDNLVAPIPASVSDLKFFSLEEQHDTHLIFRFTISPEDLDQIIKSKGFVQIDRTQFRRRDDLFTHVEYLPITEPATFYILNDVAAGYPDKGIGEGYTLKVSADRRQVIFRRESASYYLGRYWESEIEKGSEREFLSALLHSRAGQRK